MKRWFNRGLMLIVAQAPSAPVGGRAMRALRSLAFLISAAMLAITWSELAWGLASPQDHALGTVLFLLSAYTALAGILIWTIQAFGVNDLWSLILAASVFGWLAEGAIAATMLPMFPLGITWTALGWHALLTVVGGWWLLPLLLRSQSPARIAGVGGLVGLTVGIWALNSREPGQLVPPSSTYLQLVLLALFVAVLYPAFDRLRPSARLLTSPPLPALFVLLVSGWFAIGVVPSQPLAPALLLPLLGGALLLLWRHRQRAGRSGPKQLLDWGSRISPRRSVVFAAAMGTVSIAVYSAGLFLGWRLDTGVAAMSALSALGVLAWCAAVVNVLREPAQSVRDEGLNTPA